jgi:hypothetical protein
MLTRMKAALALFGTVALVLIAKPGISLADPAPPTSGTGVGCDSKAGCGVGAYAQGAVGGASTPGTPTGSAIAAGTGSVGGGSGSQAPPDPGACSWKPLPTQPGADSSLWAGNDPTGGSIEYTNCLSVAGVPQTPYRYVANAAPAGAAPVAPPPPTPEELAKQAYQQLPIPLPSMHFGPDDTRIAVRYWLYLWLDNPGAVTATAAAGVSRFQPMRYLLPPSR